MIFEGSKYFIFELKFVFKSLQNNILEENEIKDNILY